MSEEVLNVEKTEDAPRRLDFVRNIVNNDLESGKHKKIIKRFTPEPKG